eukprot:11202356-Lingulodinium_polyedra.AAC.1
MGLAQHPGMRQITEKTHGWSGLRRHFKDMVKILYHTDPFTMYGPLPDLAGPRGPSLLDGARPPPGI